MSILLRKGPQRPVAARPVPSYSPPPGSFALDDNPARPGRLVLDELDAQRALLQPGLDLVRIDRERQRHRAAEGAEAALLAVPHPLIGRLRLALALENELVLA